MAGNSAAEALSAFLKSPPSSDATSSGDLVDKLAKALLVAGDQGMLFNEAMQAAGLSRPAFLSALSPSLSAGLIESFAGADQEQRLRLTAAGRSLY